MSFKIAIHIIIDLLNFAIGIYVLSKHPRALINRIFFIFVFGIVVWSAGMILLLRTEQAVFITLTLWGGELTLLGFVLFSYVFPERKSIKKDVFLFLLPLLFLFWATPSSLFIRSVHFGASGYLEPENGPLFPLFAVIMGIYIIWGVAEVLRKHHRLRGICRVQMRYFMAGGCIFIIPAFITDVVLPTLRIFELNLL